MKRFRTILIGSAFWVFAASAALALPITGEIGMGGSYQAVDANWDVTTNDLATGIKFTPELFIALSATGSFAATVSPFELGTIKSFQFNQTNIVDFWTIDDFSFELVSVFKEASIGPEFLNLTGTGIITSTGYDATMGTWTFSGNSIKSTFSWSAGTAVSVSEPGTLVLLGMGFLGMVVARRKYK